MTTPPLTAPRFTLQLNAAGASAYGAPTLEFAVHFTQSDGIGLYFQILEHVNGVWTPNGMTTPYFYIAPDAPLLKDVNNMGIVAWIKANWMSAINALIKSTYTGKVVTGATPPAPTPADREVTAANFVSKMNDGLSMMMLTAGADGIPALVVK